MLQKIRTYIVMGFIVLLPTIITLYVLKTLFVFIDRILGVFLSDVLVAINLLEERGGRTYVLGWGWGFEDRIPGLGFLFMIIILIVVGYMVKGYTGKQAIRRIENIFKRIPIARSVYSTVQQVTSTLMQDRTSFKQVVLVEYPRRDIYTIGFLTGDTKVDIQEKTETECVNVFLPTTPNPTSGWLVIVPKQDITILDMSVEQGLKYIISGGVVAPRTQRYPILGKNNEEEDIDRILKRLDVKTELPPETRVNFKSKKRK